MMDDTESPTRLVGYHLPAGVGGWSVGDLTRLVGVGVAMSERLTDEQVADLADPSLDEIWGCEDVNTLAREVQEYRALRPTCPTCDGKRRVATRSGLGDDPCPDCTDGKMPLDKWVALLLAQCVRQRALLDDLRACPVHHGGIGGLGCLVRLPWQTCDALHAIGGES